MRSNETDTAGSSHANERLPLVAWAVVLFIAVLVYWPGLGGPFVFDDFAVFGQLGRYGGIDDWASFKAFVFGGTSGPTGRPVAMLSFLFDGSNWPTEPWAFKRTNLVIHVVNASILAMLIRHVLCLRGRSAQQASWIAAVAAGCWLLHPFLVSTTLYAVQRMAQLAAMFVFAGLLGHLYGRKLAETNTARGYLVMSLSILVFTSLATLSKENGALLPVLIGVLELTILTATGFSKLDRRWGAVFLVVPALLIGALLAYKAASQGLFGVVPPRDFSLYERLLTQPRVLSEYLANWFIPKLYTTGVFQDHVIASKSLLGPPATLVHLIVHLAILSAAIVIRRKNPIVSFAVLFFYAGHLLESTTLNLEIYFEHRNYLPAAFLFVPVVESIRDKTRWSVFTVIAVAMLLVLGGFSRYSSGIWADYSSLVVASARKAPLSTRAHSEFAKLLFNNGQYEEALAVIDTATARHAGVQQQLHITRLTFLCKQSELDDAELRRAIAGLSDLVFDTRLFGIYEEFVLSVINGECPRASLDAVHDLFSAFLRNPTNTEPGTQRLSQAQYILGLLDSRNGLPQRAVSEFSVSLEARPAVSAALNIAAVLAAAEHYQEALSFIVRARELLRQGTEEIDGARNYSESDVDRLEITIRDMITTAGGD